MPNRRKSTPTGRRSPARSNLFTCCTWRKHRHRLRPGRCRYHHRKGVLKADYPVWRTEAENPNTSSAVVQ